MRRLPRLARLVTALAAPALVALSFACAGCAHEKLPPPVALRADAQNVEIISEPPNPEIYEPAGEVTAKIVGRDNSVSLREAFNTLRNQAAAKGATFVAVDEISSTAAWDLSGRTILTLVGTAYRTK
ncbi:MAG: hypothetical protein JWP97_6076 [Labilithrix sp.]|nr:hypothetical protein [Labilithrix sp.]